MSNFIKNILEPKSIAIVGASVRPDSIGYNLVNNIIQYGYKGKIYPINPKYNNDTSLGLGVKFYDSLENLPECPDLVIIAVPSTLVIDVIEQCHNIHVQAVSIISAGFKEIGNAELEEQLGNKLKEYNIRALGPNTIGIVNNNINLNCTFSNVPQKKGNVALISQSGALGVGVMKMLETLPVGISYMVSIGNQCDIDINDLIDYFYKDDSVEQLILYLETFPNSQKFRELSTQFTKEKPIICIKAGYSEKGAISAISHTGALACNDKLANEFLEQCGILHAKSISDVLVASRMLSKKVEIKNTDVAIVTNVGGPGIMATDFFSDKNINLHEISPKIMEKLKGCLNKLASVKNPIDMVASASIENYSNAISLLNDDDVQLVLAIHLNVMGTTSYELANALQKIQKDNPDTIIVNVFITSDKEFLNILNDFPTIIAFNNIEEGVSAIAESIAYKHIVECKNTPSKKVSINEKEIQALLDNVKMDNRNMLTTFESLEFLTMCKVETCEYCLSTNVEMARQFAQSVGYPVAIKFSSKKISHKTEYDGVILNINNDKELTQSYINMNETIDKFDLRDGIEGIIVQKMIDSSREFVAGLNRDEVFGASIMFGLGGIFIEAVKDVRFKISPINECDLEKILNGIKSNKLLGEIRGKKAVDKEELKNMLRNIAYAGNTFPIIQSIDINPILVDDSDGTPFAVDARIILD